MPSTTSIHRLHHLTVLLLSTIFATSLHLFFQLTTFSYYHDPPVLVNLGVAILISCIWIKLYKWFTGESGINPFINVSATLGSPYLARLLRDQAIESGDWSNGGGRLS